MANKPSAVVQPLMQEAARVIDERVLPSLVAIYSDYVGLGGETMVRQTGTAFLVAWRRQRVMITAKHCLFGPKGDEDPQTKSVSVKGGLHYLGELKWSTITSSPTLDVLVLLVNEFPMNRCLPAEAIQSAGSSKAMHVAGYLARDFKRSAAEGALKPKPYTYANKALKTAGGLLRFHFPRSDNCPASSPLRRNGGVEERRISGSS
jgi:hypothetical protein